MLEKLQFYLQHSINDLRVNKQRTVFALLCIAAGVAAIVSLQTFGVMIDDSLTGSLQESNRGDIRIAPYNIFDDDESSRSSEEDSDGLIVSGGSYAMDYLSMDGVARIEAWFQENYPGTTISYRQALNDVSAGSSISAPEQDSDRIAAGFIVESDLYPLYGEREMNDGSTLDDVLNAPTDIVLSENLADTLDVDPGDTVKLAGASQDFTVRGVMPTNEEGGLENITGTLLGYYFIDVSAVDLFDTLTPGADMLYVKLGDPALVEEVNNAFEREFPALETTTTVDVEELNSQVSDAVNQLVMVMGLVSLLIGGIGIVNTMLVIVSRRTTEVAVLKTIGLEGSQVTVLFLAEAVIMGILGSILGILLGWVAAYVTKGAAENFLSTQLVFRITLAPALTGFVVGVVVTAIFGFLPTLAAGQVRPSLVLRPNDDVIPKAGRARSFAALLFVMLAISLVAQPLASGLFTGDILRTAAMGVGGFLGLLMGLTMIAGGIFSGWARRNVLLRVLRWLLLVAVLPVAGAAFGYAVPALVVLFGTFIMVGVLYIVLWVIIWIVGRFFPTWRLVDLRIALRSMLASKGRNASTLLALVIGVFTLSMITMLATAITKQFEDLMIDQVGGNVIVFAAGSNDTLQQVESRLDNLDGVHGYTSMTMYDVGLASVYDVSADRDLTLEQLQRRADAAGGGEAQLSWSLESVSGRGLTSNLPDMDLYGGRQLTPEQDSGPWDAEAGDYPPLVLSAYPATIDAGIEVGDLVTYRITETNMMGLGQSTERLVTFELVGMLDRTQNQIEVNFGSPNYAPVEAFNALDIEPMSISMIVDVEETQIRALRHDLNEMMGVFVLETKTLNELVTQVIDQFTSFPILVAALSLVVGGIVIANSVALATLERRREIAIMKAVGLQRERVLGMLLLEYGFMGLIGGLIGVGLGGIGLLIMLVQAFGGNLGETIPFMTAFELMGLCILIALVAAIVSAWGASGEKPLNVLRYE